MLFNGVSPQICQQDIKNNQFYGWSRLTYPVGRLRRAGRYIIELLLWPIRLMVRTPGFHPGNRGSIPLSATNYGAVVKRDNLALALRSRGFDSLQLHYYILYGVSYKLCMIRQTRCSSARQNACFGCKRSLVQIQPSRLNNK